MSAVKAHALVKRFETVDALAGIDLEVEDGEAFGLLGPNGAGKSTLISILTTMALPTSGTAEVGGHDVLRASEKVRKALGVVFQQQTLDGVMSARENLTMHGRLYKVPKADIRVRIPELLELVKLADRADEPVMNFSGGMRRRLEIARALMHRPKILFLDEPTVGLDPASRILIWEHIRELRKERQMTVLLTTHYLEEADNLCDRIAIIDHGKIVALDTPKVLKERLGGDRLKLEISGDAAAARAAVMRVPGVVLADAGGRDMLVTLREPSTTIPGVLRALGGAGIVVEKMEHKASSLDDVFLQHTGRARDRTRRKKRPLDSFRRLFGGA